MFKCGNSNINTKGVDFKLPLSFYQKSLLPDNSELVSGSSQTGYPFA